jgi:hypothetical protein
MVIHHIMALLAYVFVMVCFLRYLKVKSICIRYTVVKYCRSLETHFLIGSFKAISFPEPAIIGKEREALG